MSNDDKLQYNLRIQVGSRALCASYRTKAATGQCWDATNTVAKKVKDKETLENSTIFKQRYKYYP